SQETFPTKARVAYTGRVRRLTAGHRTAIVGWLRAFTGDTAQIDLYRDEILVREDTAALWLPIQQQTLRSLGRGDERAPPIVVFTRWLGGMARRAGVDFVFIVVAADG